MGGTRDPATPYAWSEALAKQLPGGALLTRDGDGHTSFLRGNACIDEAVVAYLVSGTVPDQGTVCDDWKEDTTLREGPWVSPSLNIWGRGRGRASPPPPERVSAAGPAQRRAFSP